MDWNSVKDFFRPNSFKLMIVFILISAYVGLTFYQAIVVYSSISEVVGVQSVGLQRLFNDCSGIQSCINESSVRTVQLHVLDLTESQTDLLIPYYLQLHSLRSVIYPGTALLVYDGEDGSGQWLDKDSGVAVIGQLFRPDESLQLPRNFYAGVSLMFLYFYFLACVAGYLKGSIKNLYRRSRLSA